MKRRFPIDGVSVLVWSNDFSTLVKAQDFPALGVAMQFINAENAKPDRRVEINSNDGSTPIKLRPSKMMSPDGRL